MYCMHTIVWEMTVALWEHFLVQEFMRFIFDTKQKCKVFLEPVVLGKFWLSKQDTPTKRGPVQGDASPLQSIWETPFNIITSTRFFETVAQMFVDSNVTGNELEMLTDNFTWYYHGNVSLFFFFQGTVVQGQWVSSVTLLGTWAHPDIPLQVWHFLKMIFSFSQGGICWFPEG